MSNPHFFQRYSQKENAVTNNTLRLLAQVYNDAPSRLESLLETVVDGISVDLDLQISQQEKTAASIPDGALYQPSLRIIIETKRGGSFSQGQLERHLEAFKDEEQKILLLLAPETPEEDNLEKVDRMSEGENVVFGAVTFSDLIDALIGEGDIVSEYETDLHSIVEDYQSFCSEEDLLPEDDVLRAVPCGRTHELNVEYDLYYMPTSRGYRSHQYVGIYYDKSIRYIGELDQDVEVERVDGQLTGETEDLSEKKREDLHELMDQKPGLETGLRFFLVDGFFPTDFSKESKHGMRGSQYFRLREELDLDDPEALPPAEEIADRLRQESWK